MDIDPFDFEQSEMIDEEMPGQMKRDLKNEFDRHSKSVEKKSQRRSIASALRTVKKTPAAIRRHSVRFVQSPGEHEMAAPLPRTPFNRDSIGRRSLAMQHVLQNFTLPKISPFIFLNHLKFIPKILSNFDGLSLIPEKSLDIV